MSTDSDGDDDLDLEETWSDARREAGLDPGEIGMVRPDEIEPGWLSPYIALYAGFFLGPVAALVSALAAAKQQLTARRVSVLIGICGAVWCGVQGATGVLGDGWSRTGVQMVRSGINFVGSSVMVVFLYREVPSCFVHNRRTIAASVGVGTLFLVGFVLAPGDLLTVLGR